MQTIKLSLLVALFLPLTLLAQRSNQPAHDWHHSFNAYYQGGISETDEFLFGAAFRYHIAYALNEKMKVGFLTGVENFNINLGEMIFPAFATFSIEQTSKKLRPYVMIGAGYGIAGMFTNRPVLETQGGIGGDIQVGYRFPIKGKTSFSTGIGYRYQEASFTSRSLFDNNDVVKRDYRYNRIYWNIGINF